VREAIDAARQAKEDLTRVDVTDAMGRRITRAQLEEAIRPLIEGAHWMEDYGVFWYVTVRAP